MSATSFPTSRSWTPALRRRFLETLTLCGRVRSAAAACGLSRQSVYRLRDRDGEFAVQWRDAVAKHHAACDREVLAGLARTVEAWLADGSYDVAFVDSVIEIAGEDFRAMLDPNIFSPEHRKFCESVSTARH